MSGLVSFDRDAVALVTEEEFISYRELGRRVDRARELLHLMPRSCLAFLCAANSSDWIVSYLACLAERMPLGLGEPMGGARERVISAYDPDVLFLGADFHAPPGYAKHGEVGDGIVVWGKRDGDFGSIPAHPSLALLLPTSGSTGDAKFVRLSASNLESNARSISSYLSIDSAERAILSLPLHYSYGLSVLNSHLVSGASVCVTRHSFMRPEFWRTVADQGCTSFAGVPYMYETLHRLRISPAEQGGLMTMTQAGGHLRPELVRAFNQSAVGKGRRFFVMYGQTEATARISYVPAERLAEKLGSIGVAIPGGVLELEALEGDPDHRQLIYRGPNVMLGYAQSPADLVRGDEQLGRLATGDLATADEDGYFRITGRLARFAKLFGKRISLNAVEAEIESRLAVRCIALERDARLVLLLETGDAAVPPAARAHACEWLGVPPPALDARMIRELPMTANGKKDYKALT